MEEKISFWQLGILKLAATLKFGITIIQRRKWLFAHLHISCAQQTCEIQLYEHCIYNLHGVS